MDGNLESGSDSTSGRFAEIAVAGGLGGSGRDVLTYAVSSSLPSLRAGQVVWVPLRQRVDHGVVVEIHDVQPPFAVRDIHAQVEPPIVLTPRQLDFGRWLARETASSLYSCLALMVPPGLSSRTEERYRLAIDRDEMPLDLTAAQRRVVDILVRDGDRTLESLRAATGRALTSVIPRLLDLGIVSREVRLRDRPSGARLARFVRLVDPRHELTGRAPKQAAVRDELAQIARMRRSGDSDLVSLADLRQRLEVDSTLLDAMSGKGIIEVLDLPPSEAPPARFAPSPMLTSEQAGVWATLEAALVARDPTPHLLFGVTGSGKTELYLRAVAWCLRHERAAIVLVPEIGLATQVVRRFIDRFPGEVVVWHSGLTDGQRYDIWQGIANGDHRVVVGPRSALFAPAGNLGLIVLDEEHESTYKQDSEPRYHARTVASRLAQESGAALVLGSATPAVESAWHAARGDYRRLELAQRVNPHAGRGDTAGLELPRVDVIDVRRALQSGMSGLISPALHAAVTTSLDRQEQAILLLNRRGTSTVVLCRTFGHRVECPHCDVPLVFHRDRQQLMCHRCDYRAAPPRSCPECDSPLDYFGAGTQRVEDEARRAFPRARVMRWDADAVRRQGGYARMLARVEHGEVDLIVGTQMVAKGFDLPRVTTIGVVQADTLLHLPDFRSAERTFQLLTQVAGRAGRRAGGSRVVVQSYTPEHYAIAAASKHDFAAFYDEEIDFRERHGYPPFVRLVRYSVRHAKERDAAMEAEMMARELARHARQLGAAIDLLGPTPAFAARIRGKYQWQIVVRSAALDAFLDHMPVRPGWTADVDPQSML